jgi:hypothetical protein
MAQLSEWLQIMLAEIARKQLETQHGADEQQRRAAELAAAAAPSATAAPSAIAAPAATVAAAATAAAAPITAL